MAAKQGNYEAPLALLRHGADVHQTFVPAGRRPIHFACQFLNEDVVELLLRWDADETVIDSSGGNASETLPTVATIQARHRFHASTEEDMEAEVTIRERILALLARAPNERAWSRRRFVVLCRAHPERLRLACGGKGTSSTTGDCRSGSSSNKVARQEISGTSGEGIGGEEGCAIGSFGRLAAWLMELPEVNLFRHMVEFL